MRKSKSTTDSASFEMEFDNPAGPNFDDEEPASPSPVSGDMFSLEREIGDRVSLDEDALGLDDQKKPVTVRTVL